VHIREHDLVTHLFHRQVVEAPPHFKTITIYSSGYNLKETSVVYIIQQQ